MLLFIYAGDFALIADLNNRTIYAGSMGQALVDLAPLPLSGIQRPLAVDYDPVMEMVYWTDVQGIPSSRISRAHLNGSNQRTLVENLRSETIKFEIKFLQSQANDIHIYLLISLFI